MYGIYSIEHYIKSIIIIKIIKIGDSIIRPKTDSLKFSGPLRHKEDLVILLIKDLIPLVQYPPTFYGLPKIHECGTLSGPLFSAGVSSHVEWQKSWPTL